MNKKGISTIVATVLIVLITVAAVTILWAAISPLIDQNVESATACFDAQNALSIDTDKTYSCYTVATDTVSYRIERTSNDAEIVNMTLYYDIDGTTGQHYVDASTDVPRVNGAIADSFVSADLATATKVTLSVAPMIVLDGEHTACEATVPVTLSAC